MGTATNCGTASPSTALNVTESGPTGSLPLGLNVPVNVNLPSASGRVAVPLAGAVAIV